MASAGESPREYVRALVDRVARLAQRLFSETEVGILTIHDGSLDLLLDHGPPGRNLRHFHESLEEWPVPGPPLPLVLSTRPDVGAPSPAPVPGDRCVLFLLGYRGSDDILRGVQAMALSPTVDLPAEGLQDHLVTAGLPDPDLAIVTGARPFVPDSLTYQLSYSEVAFTHRPWESFSWREMRRALDDFGRRERRFGKVLSDRQPG
jgi:hypothetical protein